MAELYKPQTRVDWTSNEAFPQFKLWRKEVDRILGGPLAAKNDAIKMNHVYIWAGAKAEQLIEARINENPDLNINTAEKLLDELSACLTHETSFREAREDFYNIKQKLSENTTTYYSRIINLYKQAEFPDNTDFLIVDKLIHGCNNMECRRKLMTKGKDVTVKDCLDLLRRFEAVDATMKRFGGTDQPTSTVNATYSRDPTRKSQRNGSKKKTTQHSGGKAHKPTFNRSKTVCSWCGKEAHPREECPAKDAICRHCFKKGHFQKVCIKKKKSQQRDHNKSQNIVNADTSEEEDELDIGSVYLQSVQKKQQPREVLASVRFNSHTAVSSKAMTIEHTGKVDTGAMVSCMPLSILSSIGLTQQHLTQSKINLRGFSGTDLVNLGYIDIMVTCNNIHEKARFYVTESGRELLLGIKFCKKFKLVSYASACILNKVTVDEPSPQHSESNNLDVVHIMDESEADYAAIRQKWKAHLPLGKKTGDALKDLKLIFPTMFDGSVGLFDGKVSLKLSSEAKPVQLPPRAIPQSIMPQLKNELDKMEQEGIIRPCPETTEWVHNLVTVVKKNGSLRLCLDPKNLNKYLIRNVHYTASWEDAQHSFKTGQYFSTLDAKSGYWTKLLDEKSQLLTAFNTPFKKYCFVRLPFGLSVSSEIFCEHMDRALQGIPGTFPCADDVKVQGSTEERHDLNLLETVSRAQRAGLKFNPDKCQIKKRQVEYFGRLITPEGIKPCPQKVQAVINLAAPTDKQDLQSFLGSVTFMSTFIPNLSQKTHLMRGLLKKDVHFVWTSDMQQNFNSIKQAIASATTLVHYDPNRPATIETDASLKGLGAVLIQDGKPVRFLSKSLTQAEVNYANIERELLAVLFACEKLHNYTFGRLVTIHTDHKPLESILQKPISLAPARLQRMLLRLAKYNIKVEYVGAKRVLLADTLSRLLIPGKDKEVAGLDVTIAQVLKIAPTRLESLRAETQSDPTLQLVSDYIRNGWPTSMQDLTPGVEDYWCFRDELTILDGLVMKGNRVIIPSVMRMETLNRLHDAHQGITSTLQRARRTVYWPKMQYDITDLIDRCQECQIYAKKKPRPPERQVTASRPSQMLGADLMELNGQSGLVTIDFYSGYITYDAIDGESAETVIKALNRNFQKFGLVEEIYSDNGPCFKSEKFAKFCRNLDIAHQTSSPHYHQSMGRVERAIQTVKRILKKSTTIIDVTCGLITYHDTPINDILPSPAELFFGRRINTRLGLMCLPSTMTDVQKQELSRQRAAHLKEPRQVRDDYTPNQPIWFTEDGCSEWKPGVIESRDPHPGSYWIYSDSTNRRLRRNKHDLKPRHMPPITHTQNRDPYDKDYTPPSATPPDTTSPTPNESTSALTPAAEQEIRTPTPDDTAISEGSDVNITPATRTSRYGRILRDNRDPDYVYE